MLIGLRIIDASTGKYLSSKELKGVFISTHSYDLQYSGNLDVFQYFPDQTYTWSWKGFMVFGHWLNDPHNEVVQY